MAVVAPIVSTWDNRGVRQAEAAFGGLSNSAGRTFSKIAGFAKSAALAVGTIGVVAVGAAAKAINAASDLAEAQSKINVIFGSSAKAIEAFGATAARSFGLSKQAVYDAAGTFGIFGKAAGLSGDDLANFATSFTGLAADLASFNNTTPEEAIEAIGAALRGEAEPLRRYGVLINDAALKQKALQLGIYNGNGALTSQQKILAAQALIWEQTSDAQGDFSRTSSGLANQSRILKAQLANVTAEIGEKLLPIALKIANFVNDKLIPAFESLYRTFKQEGISGVFKKIKDAIEKYKPIIVEKLKDLGEKLWQWIKDNTPKAIDAIAKLIGSVFRWLITDGLDLIKRGTRVLGDKLVAWVEENWPKIQKQLGIWLGKIIGFLVTEAAPKLAAAGVRLGIQLISFIPGMIGAAVRGFLQFGAALLSTLGSTMWQVIQKAFQAGTAIGQAVINGLSNGVRALVSGASNVAQAIANAIVGAFKTLWNNYIARPVNNAIAAGVNALDVLLGPSINFPTPGPVLPYLANGGIVDSPMLAVIGDRRLSQGKNREAVVPLDRNHNLGGNLNIVINGALDPVAVAKQIRKILADNQHRLGYLAAV